MRSHQDHKLTIQQAAVMIGCSSKTLYRYMQAGTLTYKRGVNGRRYLSQTEVEVIRKQRDKTVNRRQIQPDAFSGEIKKINERLLSLENCLIRAVELIKPGKPKELLEKRELVNKIKRTTIENVG